MASALQSDLKGGQTLAQVATAQGKTVAGLEATMFPTRTGVALDAGSRRRQARLRRRRPRCWPTSPRTSRDIVNPAGPPAGAPRWRAPGYRTRRARTKLGRGNGRGATRAPPPPTALAQMSAPRAPSAPPQRIGARCPTPSRARSVRLPPVRPNGNGIPPETFVVRIGTGFASGRGLGYRR